MSQSKKINIIVQCYNSTILDLQKTFDSLREQTNNNFNLIVFDNGSTRNIDYQSLTHGLNPRIIFNKNNKGVANGRNLSTKNVKEGLIVRLDDGDALDENFIDILIEKSKYHDVIFLREYANKKYSFTDMPSHVIVDKQIFMKFPEGPGYYIEDFSMRWYYLSIANNPFIDYKNEMKYFRQKGNSRWQSKEHSRTALRFLTSSHKDYWEASPKITKKGFFDKKHNMEKHYLETVRTNADICDKKHLSAYFSILKDKRSIMNPKMWIWPIVIFRFFKKE